MGNFQEFWKQLFAEQQLKLRSFEESVQPLHVLGYEKGDPDVGVENESHFFFPNCFLTAFTSFWISSRDGASSFRRSDRRSKKCCFETTGSEIRIKFRSARLLRSAFALGFNNSTLRISIGVKLRFSKSANHLFIPCTPTLSSVSIFSMRSVLAALLCSKAAMCKSASVIAKDFLNFFSEYR